MQIVIDIPDKVYGLLKYFEEAMGLADKANKKEDDVKTVLMRAVVNGTPLPRGMSCETCEELKAEKNIVRITEIEIEGMYYHWNRKIKYCPTCGKNISNKAESEDTE